MAKCNRDCFKCPYDDCIANDITLEERLEMKERDIKFASYGIVHRARPQRAKRRTR